MMLKYVATAALAVSLAAPAFAQSSTGNGNTQGMTGNNSSGMTESQGNGQAGNRGSNGPLAQKFKQDLAQDGFTDIHVMPQSYMVRAKDKQGRPVMMVINPDSVLAVTQTAGNAPDSGASGASGNNGGMQNGNNGSTHE